MRFDVLTIFPEFFDSPLRTSILGRALEAGHVAVNLHNIRDWATDKHHSTDDAPYGGGGGMVMLAEPLLRCIRDVRSMAHEELGTDTPVIYLSPQGTPLTQPLVQEMASLSGMILLCGSYEGIDERVVDLEIDREISIGDFVLTSGELPALVLINAISRRLAGVLGNPTSAERESFEAGLLDFPHYTRPELVEGLEVPPVLLSGHHAKIEEWRRWQALVRTARRRPELLSRVTLNDSERRRLRDERLWPPHSIHPPAGITEPEED